MLAVVLFFYLLSPVLIMSDNHESCEFWASKGECEKNPQYMLENCQAACAKKTLQANLPVASSLYDIVENDINGNPVDFSLYRGKVLYIVNVASKCGYTAENYEMFRKLSKYREQGLEIFLAPCNQFGSQEPGSADVITAFADKQKFQGIILSKADVNGANTRSLFAYLKHSTGKNRIAWNFDGKFLVDREGSVVSVNSDNVEREIVELLSREEL